MNVSHQAVVKTMKTANLHRKHPNTANLRWKQLIYVKVNVSQHAEHKLHCFYIDFKGKNERKEI